MMRRAAILLVLLALAVPAAAQRPWQQLSPEEQQRAWENYQRYREMPSQRRNMIERRYRQFQSMPPEEQQRLRQNYETYRGFDSGKRREFVEKYHRWKGRR